MKTDTKTGKKTDRRTGIDDFLILKTARKTNKKIERTIDGTDRNSENTHNEDTGRQMRIQTGGLKRRLEERQTGSLKGKEN